jgi:hypothetical protein
MVNSTRMRMQVENDRRTLWAAYNKKITIHSGEPSPATKANLRNRL